MSTWLKKNSVDLSDNFIDLIDNQVTLSDNYVGERGGGVRIPGIIKNSGHPSKLGFILDRI